MRQQLPHPERTQVKSLNGVSMMCEVSGCESSAGYLFRSGNGPIAAYCERHGREAAARQGLRLPERVEKALAGW
jgi:hypothetical protein